MYFGKRCSSLSKLRLQTGEIEWVDTWKYLGITLKSGKYFGCTVSDRIRKFYKCANAIFRIEGHSDEITMLRLTESHCIPLLTYAIEIVHICDCQERSKLRVAYNSVFRKIIGYRHFESVRELQGLLFRLTWEELIDKRTDGFLSKLRHLPSSSPVHLFEPERQ